LDVSRLRFRISMSLDGFVAGPDQSEDHPLGIGGERLHEWAFELAVFRRHLGIEGGTTFTFVTEEIEAALGRARSAASGKDV
jgi:hypothetical protein